MLDVVERFRAELERFDDDDEGVVALRFLFEDEVVPHIRELEQRALDEAWDIVEAAMEPPEGESDVDTARRAADMILAARESDGEVGSREALRAVADQLGLPPDVGVLTVVDRARDVVSAVQAGMGAQAELVGRFAAAAGVSARTDVAAEVVAAVWDLRAQADARGDALREIVGVCAVRDAGSAPDPDPRAVVMRVRNTVEGLRIRLGADGGLDLDEQDRSMLRAVGEGWVREVGEHGALRWQPPGAGAEPFESADWARFERLRDAGLVSTGDAEHPYLTEQGRQELGRDAAAPRGAVRYRSLAGRAWDVLWKVAALPGIEVAQEAVRGDPEAVLGAVRAALAELHEVRQIREGPAPAPDVVGVARVRELLRAADDLRELPAVGGWWARGAREQERMRVAAWLVRRARTIVDAPERGDSDGG